MSKMHCGSGKIANVECVREGGKFILCNFTGGFSDLFTARFRAPGDYQAGDVFVFHGKELPVLTQEMQSAPGGVFRAGAVVHADIDLACGRAFVGTGGSAGGGSGTETDPVYTADKPSLAPLASPVFVGTPKAPTAPAGTATTQLATTEFVATAIEEADGAPSAAFVMVPDYSNQDPTEHGLGPWTADKDGFVLIDCGSPSPSMGIIAYVNEKRVFYGVYQADAVLPISKGDVIRIDFSGSGRKSIFYIPPKYVPVNRGYSTDEQLTGETWIDGRPVWRRVFTGIIPASGTINLGVINDLDIAFSISGVWRYGGQEWNMIPYVSSNAAAKITAYVDSSGVKFSNTAGSSYTGQPIYIIVHYVKA